MARAKKTEKAEQSGWVDYFAIQLTPKEKAEARAEMQEKIDQARRDGVYERLLGLVDKVKWTASWEEMRKEDDESLKFSVMRSSPRMMRRSSLPLL